MTLQFRLANPQFSESWKSILNAVKALEFVIVDREPFEEGEESQELQTTTAPVKKPIDAKGYIWILLHEGGELFKVGLGERRAKLNPVAAWVEGA